MSAANDVSTSSIFVTLFQISTIGIIAVTKQLNLPQWTVLSNVITTTLSA